jgi:hypothetical protein
MGLNRKTVWVGAVCVAELVACVAWAGAQQWTQPTAEELAMTSIPQVPGAPAVVLYREEKTDDSTHTTSYYVRVKVLTDKGKEYANVELPYTTGRWGIIVDAIEGRTIHPDGTAIALTGKPYDKLVAKEGGSQIKEKVFTMPSVEIGSILEYRYKTHIDDYYFMEPEWYVQGDLFIRKAHFMWRPTDQELILGSGGIGTKVAWAPILPAGAEVVRRQVPGEQNEFDLDVHDVPPLPVEDDMPPMQSLSYRVLFYYTSYNNATDYCAGAGKDWSKNIDTFIGPSGAVKEYVHTLVGDSDSEDVKARKLYAAVMTFENVRFTREHTAEENNDPSFRTLRSDDVLKRKYGNGRQLTGLFVGMARAAGLKAYVMGVADRNERIWNPNFTSLRQLDDWVAIVEIDGKDVYFDPGERYCEPEHLAWKHTLVGGLRQTANGTAIGATPGESYKAAKVVRVADLKLDDKGDANGAVLLSWTGDPALQWRQRALATDETKLHEDLVKEMREMLPDGMEVKLAEVSNLTEYEKPLKARFEVEGPVGSSTGKRLLVPADVFEANAKPRFTEAKRETPVDLHYARQVQDVMRLTLPNGLTIESTPEDDKQAFANKALFEVKATRAAGSVTSYRTTMLAMPLFLPGDYDGLRGFYGKLDAKDQETIVLSRAPGAAAGDASKKPGS